MRLASIAASGLIALVPVLAAGPLVGCQSSMLGGDAVTQAMNALSPAIKNAASGYLGGLGDITKLLGGLTSNANVLAALPQLDKSFGSLGSYTKVLSGLTGADKSNLATAFGSQIGDANALFTNQATRLLGDKNLAGMLKPLLDKAPLLKL